MGHILKEKVILLVLERLHFIMKNSIFKNSILKLILTSCNVLFPLIVSPYIASLFSETQASIDSFGAYNDANGIMYIFLAFAIFGVYNYGIREISRLRDNHKLLSQVFTNLFCISLITTTITSVLYYFFVIYVLNTSYAPIYLVMLVQIGANVLSIEWVNEACENYKFITIKTITVRFCYVVCVFAFVKDSKDIFIYAFIVVMSAFANNLLSFVYIKSKIKFDFTDLNLARYLKPLLAMLVINNVAILYTQLDRFFLGRYFVEKVAVTEYSLPLNAINMIGAMLISLIIVSIPRLSFHISRGDKESYMKLLNTCSQGFFIILFPACIGLACISYEAMYLYTNGAYAYTSDILALFSLRFLIISVYSIFSNQILYIHNKEGELVLILLIGGIINLVLDVILMFVGVFSPMTAIVSTTIAEFIMLTIMYTFIRTKMEIRYMLFSVSNMKYLCYSLTFLPITYLIKQQNLGVAITFVSVIFSCMLVYVLILLVTKDEFFNYFLVKLKLSKKNSKITLE